MSSSSTQGYTTEVSYVSHYFDFCNPPLLDYIGACAGYAPSREKPSEPFTYCDLGCGSAKTLNIMAAANPHGQFYGMDLNPEHIAEAQRFTDEAANDNVTLLARDIAAGWEDLPVFDYMVLHGFISWVSPEIRSVALRFVAEKLKPNGRLLISYNAMPGGRSIGLLGKFLNLTASNTDPGLPQAERAKVAVDAARFLRDSKVPLFSAGTMGDRVDDLKEIQYVMHEFFNSHSLQFYFSDVAQELAALGLSYAGDVELPLNRADLVIPSGIRSFHDWFDDPVQRETIKDFIMDNSFRRDVYVKSGMRVSPEHAMNDLSLCLLRHPDQISYERNFPAGHFRLNRDIHRAIIDLLATGPKTFAALAACCPAGLMGEALVNAVQTACAFSQIFPCSGRPQPERTQAINRRLLAETEHDPRGQAHVVLASTTFGSGYPLSFEMAAWLTAVNETPGESLRIRLDRAIDLAVDWALKQGWFSEGHVALPAGMQRARLRKMLEDKRPEFTANVARYEQMGLLLH